MINEIETGEDTENAFGLWAHTPSAIGGRPHDLGEHLIQVARQAREFAVHFGAGDIAFAIGLLHDLGKANPEFQQYLRAQFQGKNHPSVPHAVWGAALVYALVAKVRGDTEWWKVLALPVQGHHAGLYDAGQAGTKLDDFLKKGPQALDCMQRAMNLLGISVPNLSVSLPDLNQKELFVRMLFSSLVDADYLDTERHFDSNQHGLRGKGPTLKSLWEKLEEAQKGILDDSNVVNRIRKEVYEACIVAASGETGIYRLTVPTGGGKTRSALAFALKHAIAKRLQRVVVAIPYTSIIDQTAEVYRDILGDGAVLEHHSGVKVSEDEDEQQSEQAIRWRLAAENWDVRLIVTTTVQLFESLFSNRPSAVRKLHRLSRSVIVLDEVQTLPPGLLLPTLDVLKWLAKPVDRGGYGATLVLCTATQPTYEALARKADIERIAINEIVPEYPRYFHEMRRVEYDDEVRTLSWKDLAKEIEGLAQALVVLNTRKDALALLTAVDRRSDAYHLSTLLCGAHRKKILEEVKDRLITDQHVLLISTQVVEAGVDLDFPVVYRAVGPLDRIVQVAGRCNRHGNRPVGRVVVFEPSEGKAPGGPYKTGIEKARFLLRDNPKERLHDPDFYREYYNLLFADVKLDEKEIQSYRTQLNYPEVARRYKLIDQDTVQVVVPYENAFEYLGHWQHQPSYRTWRRLQTYLVNLFRKEVCEKRDWLGQVSENLFFWKGRYDDRVGIVEGYSDPADLVV